jgi:hypothetical protein
MDKPNKDALPTLKIAVDMTEVRQNLIEIVSHLEALAEIFIGLQEELENLRTILSDAEKS